MRHAKVTGHYLANLRSGTNLSGSHTFSQTATANLWGRHRAEKKKTTRGWGRAESEGTPVRHLTKAHAARPDSGIPHDWVDFDSSCQH